MSEPVAAPRTKAQKILRRTLWGTGLAAGLAGALWWNAGDPAGRPVAVLAALFALLGALELGRMGRVGELGLRPALALGGVVAVLAALASAPGLLGPGRLEVLRGLLVPAGGVDAHYRLLGGHWLVPVLVLVPLVGLPFARSERPLALRALAAGVFSLWVGLAFATLPAVWATLGQSGLVALLVLSKVGDIAGYYVGSAIGRRHPFPGISPGKTVAGCNASLVVTVLVAMGCVRAGWILPEHDPLWGGAAFGAVVNLAAQAGDLFESWVKRRAQVKDSGTWFGPSGGVLDLVDSLLFTVPVALATWPWLLGVG